MASSDPMESDEAGFFLQSCLELRQEAQAFEQCPRPPIDPID